MIKCACAWQAGSLAVSLLLLCIRILGPKKEEDSCASWQSYQCSYNITMCGSGSGILNLCFYLVFSNSTYSTNLAVVIFNISVLNISFVKYPFENQKKDPTH